MKKIIIALCIMSSSIGWGQALSYIPPPSAAYLFSGGAWSPWTSGSGTALTFTPPAIGLYCSASGTQAGPWTPCAPSSGGGSGTVTSVAFAGDGTVFSTTPGTVVTTSGNVSPSGLVSQSANTFFAAPNGSAGTPAFRAIFPADVPTLNQNSTGSAGSVPWSGVTSGANAQTGAFSTTASWTYTGATAASTPAIEINSTPFAGTTGTSYGTLDVTWGTQSTLTNLNTAGEAFTVRAPSGFAGSLCHWYVGTVAEFYCTAGGAFTAAGGITSGGTISAATGANLSWTSRSSLSAPADGIVKTSNNAGTSLATVEATYLSQTIGTAIASAATIAPVTGVFHVTGTTAISTMTPPTGMSSTIGGSLTLIADAAWSLTAGTTTGQFKSALTAVAGVPYICVYDGLLWYCK